MTLASTIATQARKIGTAATQGIQAQTAKEILAERKRAARSVKKALLKEKAALKMAHAFKKKAHQERRKRLHAVKLAQVTVAKTEKLTHKTLSNLAAKEKTVEANEAAATAKVKKAAALREKKQEIDSQAIENQLTKRLKETAVAAATANAVALSKMHAEKVKAKKAQKQAAQSNAKAKAAQKKAPKKGTKSDKAKKALLVELLQDDAE